MEVVEVLGVNISNVTMDGAVETASGFFDGGVHVVFTPNPEIVMLARRDGEFRDILNSADLTLPDGIGVVIASRMLGKPLPQRVAGFDFIGRMLKTGRTFYLFGAKPGVADAAAEKLRGMGVRVVGTHHGYFDDDSGIIDDINEKKPDVLLVCLGAPKQEQWVHANRHRLNVGLCIAAGGTLDGIAGNVRRAPEIVRRLGLEWLYRAVRQPSRLARLAVIPVFLIAVAGDAVRTRGKRVKR